MDDRKTLHEVMNQMKRIEENLSSNFEQLTSIDLLLTSDNNGTVKDAKISKNFSLLKEKLEEAADSAKVFMDMLEKEHRHN
ncbi:hypothetical protein SAMN02745975_03796 [Geosporobacter subterraneus DSM 17957]|uniref:Uncharacterized protein n=1 Tax=Geosporobacter subterraneus DSM 17957 TaxID=1121919 RepID=A0A1M6Q9J1_9FIRM|nr:hypothetical protein [Geosporobacter subterraneus]SHK16851.1 hypothetical protein SAMN02745975_03796 [Geosporobacter subterraneus DSM 17957]